MHPLSSYNSRKQFFLFLNFRVKSTQEFIKRTVVQNRMLDLDYWSVQGRAQEGEENYSLSKETFEEFRKLEVPVGSQTKYYSTVQSFNGLICITESNFNDSYHSFNTFLWNPATTKEFRALPESTINSNISAVIYGDWYRICIPSMIAYFIVYSMSTDCSRKIKSNIGLECYIGNKKQAAIGTVRKKLKCFWFSAVHQQLDRNTILDCP